MSLFALATVGNSSGDNNHACHVCRLPSYLCEISVTLFIAFAGSETLACYFLLLFF